ncbi:hypothetical protein PRZ48_003967 [Zasmidium cellare]|uniref:Cobalamin-independent methionine synthase MetE C-terminal/archaeal domain-containing protein n=1 Tax=Zasmidium cellare TaxID=395010 RepID=A0ABR0EWX7_ZASCE|nr:hypothetical protein PRZ48_003967 [Zasmidium cellare]
MPPKITNVHLVGSIPLSNTEEVLRTVSQTLPNRLRRIPDGETGERNYFVKWQARIIGQWPLVWNGLMRWFMGLEDQQPPSFSEEEKEKVLREMESLETEYDVKALESYEVFKKLKEEGVIEKDVKFLVALPTPLTVTALNIRKEFHVGFERVYKEAILRALGRIMEGIPKRELAIQWDCPSEMGMIEGVDFKGRETGKWWAEGMVEGVVERLKRVCESVDEGVEMGVHFCYGDMQGKHFVEPKDTGVMVDVATRLLDTCNRPIDFLHIPVPKDRTDDQYFEPLKGLLPYVRDGHELCLGLVHTEDLGGTWDRIQTAGKVVPAFSISSECGLGRKSREQGLSVLDTAFAVCEPVVSKAKW